MANGISKVLSGEHWRGLTPLLLLLLSMSVSVAGSLLVWAVNDLRDDIKIMGAKTLELEIRLTSIEANRFTVEDGFEMLKLIEQKFPPPWLVQKVDKNDTRIDEMESRL